MTRQVQRELDRYVKYRIPTGGFLRAVLENDFIRAIGKADEDNMATLPEIRDYIIANLPMACYGSVKAVKDWLKGRHKV